MVAQKIIKKILSPWVFFITIFCLEFILFRHRILKEITNYYPVGVDQASYLTVVYNTYENIQNNGFISGLHKSTTLTNGLLFPLQTIFSFAILGVSRLSALFPNIIYFLALQFVTLYVLTSLTNKKYPLILMLGLILSLKSPIQLTGGIFDFRMDLIAFCLYGILIASIIKSEIFLNKNWSIFAGVCIIFMILMRGITLTYAIGVISAMTVYLFYTVKTTLDFSLKENYKKRLLHCFSIFIMLFLLTLIYILLNYQALYNYYVIGHVLSNEKHIRANEVGIHNIFQMLLYYPSTLFKFQIGFEATRAPLIFLAIYILLIISHPKKIFTILDKKYNLTQNGIPFWRDGFIFLLISFLVPIIILTMDTSKSPIVGAIVTMPVLWLILWCIFFLDHKLIIKKYIFYLFNTIAIFTLLFGLNNQIKECLHKHRPFSYTDLDTLNQLYTDIGNYAIKHQWKDFTVASDRITEYLFHNVIVVNYYEKYGKLLYVDSNVLGRNLLSTTKENLFNALKKTNVVIFNVSNDYPAQSPYPADLQIAQLKPLLVKYADTHFDRLGDYKIKNSIYRVYVEKNAVYTSNT